MNWLSETTSNIIYEEIFGVYSIMPMPTGTYKVYKRRDCVKLEKYKELRSSDMSLSEDDYNEYFMLARTHNTLFHAVMWIAEQNLLFNKSGVTTLYKLIIELNKYVSTIK